MIMTMIMLIININTQRKTTNNKPHTQTKQMSARPSSRASASNIIYYTLLYYTILYYDILYYNQIYYNI